MNKSETIEKLASALSKLQNEIQNAYKDKAGYGYKYVELSSILDSCRPLLSKHELAISQLCSNECGDLDMIGVETILMHSSGQHISSTLHLRVTPNKGMSAAQAAGSVITYARRYALAAILGIAQTDTDAHVEKEDVKEAPGGTFKKPAPPGQILNELIIEKKLDDKIPIWLKHFKVKDLSELSNEQVLKLIERIEEIK